jgi:hypothetical protein
MEKRRSPLAVWMTVTLCLLGSGGAARRAEAHGLHGHIHVTGWAIENLPPGELKDFFADPDLFKAALAGAMFPDTGYAINQPAAREYAEYAHWEPFIERFIQHVLSTYGPTYDTKDEQLLVAFLLGCASHGLQDELFDSTFLFEVEERDTRGQDDADPGTDGFLILDGYFRLLPSNYLPIDDVLPLFGVLGQPIDRALIEDHVGAVRGAYVNDFIGIRIAATNGTRLRPLIPWAGDNYIDPGVSGSLAAEIEPTARHMEALWERLHGRFDEANLVVHGWPDAPRRLRSADHNSVASWVTLVFGKGVAGATMTGSLVDDNDAPHPFNLSHTRWGGWDGISRVARFRPAADFVPGGDYVATLEAEARLVDGSVTTQSHSFAFQVECDSVKDAACPPVVIDDDPTIIVFSPTPSRTVTPTRTPPLPTPTPTVPSCLADCSHDLAVTVDELIICVNIAMTGSLTCAACDTNGDGRVTVDELVQAVNVVLNGC